jgi:hypothetical protein
MEINVQLHPPWKSPWHLLDRRMAGSNSWFDQSSKEKSLPLPTTQKSSCPPQTPVTTLTKVFWLICINFRWTGCENMGCSEVSSMVSWVVMLCKSCSWPAPNYSVRKKHTSLGASWNVISQDILAIHLTTEMPDTDWALIDCIPSEKSSQVSSDNRARQCNKFQWQCKAQPPGLLPSGYWGSFLQG